MACDAPISIKYDPPISDGKGGFIYYFPGDCGKCLKCLYKRKAEWSFRMVQEKRDSFSAYFVTLTYAEWSVPVGEDGYCGNKNDHSDFVRWLRYFENEKRLKERGYMSSEELTRVKNSIDEYAKDEKGNPKFRLKYYCALEYGDSENGRPHFHYILFNVHDINNIDRAWSEILRDSEGNYYPNRSKGKIDIQECNVNTIDYVLKYMVKDKKEGENEDKQKECSFMSKGIGVGYVDPEFIRYAAKPESNQVVNTRGSKIALPRYYRKKFLSEEENMAKRTYIAAEVAKTEEMEDKKWTSQGEVPDKVRQRAKEARYTVIKKRARRPID